jgi:hypothetical protein
LTNKKVDKFQLCLTIAASLFPFSCMTFLMHGHHSNNIISDMTLSITTLSTMTLKYNNKNATASKRTLHIVNTVMLSVINKPIILSVIKLIVVRLNIVAPQNSVCRLRVQILKLAMTNAGLGDFHIFFIDLFNFLKQNQNCMINENKGYIWWFVL